MITIINEQQIDVISSAMTPTFNIQVDCTNWRYDFSKKDDMSHHWAINADAIYLSNDSVQVNWIRISGVEAVQMFFFSISSIQFDL